jgi:hypothetical protein
MFSIQCYCEITLTLPVEYELKAKQTKKRSETTEGNKNIGQVFYGLCLKSTLGYETI